MLLEDLFHGTHHSFERFSVDHIGSGEGAQIYGWGLYFASNRDVAQFYRDAMESKNKLLFDNKPIDFFLVRTPEETAATLIKNNFKTNLADAVLSATLHAEKVLKQIGKEETTKKNYCKKVIKLLQNEDFIKRFTVVPISASVYRVHVPESSEFLLWDTSFRQQSKKVKDAFRNLKINAQKTFEYSFYDGLADDMGIVTSDYYNNVLGKSMGRLAVAKGEYKFSPHGMLGRGKKYPYKWCAIAGDEDQHKGYSNSIDRAIGFINQHIGGRILYQLLENKLGSAKEASLALLNQGVHGIKYLDQGSRSKTTGTYNYVIFDASLANIVDKD